MSKLKKFKGNYVQVIDQLGLPKSFYGVQPLDEYNDQIDKDLPRTSYLSYTMTAEDMKKQFRDTSHLTEDTLSYTQGNLEGGVITDSQVKTSPKYFKTAMLASKEGTVPGMFEALRIAYIDDDGIPCALAISFIRDDPDTEQGEAPVPIDQRKRLFSVAHIKNTILAPSEREVTVLSNPVLLSEVAKNGVDIEDTDIPGEVNELVNSKKLGALLSGIFNGDSISLEKFKVIEERLPQNGNIDNRDVKKRQLEEFFSLAIAMLPNDKEIEESIDDLRDRSLNEADFFKDGDFEETLNTFFIQVSTQLDKLPNKEEAELSLLNTKLTYYAVQLELRAFPLHLEADAILRATYLEQAKKLRDLRDEPLSEKEEYKDMFFSQLNNQVQDLAAKRVKLSQFVKKENQKCDDDVALAYVDELKNNINKGIDSHSYTDKRLDIALNLCSKKVEVFLEERALILHDKIMDFADQLEDHVKHHPALSEEMSQGILNKAKSLRELSNEESKEYRNLDFEKVLSGTTTEIENAQFKREFLESFKKYADNLPANAPPFLQQRIKDKAGDLEEIAPKQFVKLYKGKDFSEIVTNLFKDERTKQEKDLRTKLKNDLEGAKPRAPEDQGFFGRNRASLIIGGLAVLAFVSLVLTLTGVLAPLGIALGAATAVTAGLVGAVTAGAVAVGAGTQVANNEIEFSDDKNEYLNQAKTYQAKVASFKADSDKAVGKAVGEFKEIQSQFMNEHFKEDSIPVVDLPVVEVGVSLDRDVAPNLDGQQIIDEIIPGFEDADELLKQAIPHLETGETAVQQGFNTTVKTPITIPEQLSGQSVSMRKDVVDEEKVDDGLTVTIK